MRGARSAAYATLLAFAVGLPGAAGCGRVGYELLPRGDAPEASGGTAGLGGSADDAAADAPSASGGRSDAGAGGARAGGAPGSGGREPDASTPETDSGEGGAADAGRCRAPVTAPDYCASLPLLAETPVIDGALDCGLRAVPMALLGWNGSDGGLPRSISAEYAVAYRPDGLYFYVRVHDPTLVPADPTAEAWQGDGIELYVDADGTFAAPPAFDDPGTRQVQVTAPTSSVAVSTRADLFTCGVGTSRVSWTAPRFGSYPTADGYVVEAFVTAAEIPLPALTLAAGAHVGVDVGINISFDDPAEVNGSQGHRAGQAFLSLAPTGAPAPFDSVGAFCLPLLAP